MRTPQNVQTQFSDCRSLPFVFGQKILFGALQPDHRMSKPYTPGFLEYPHLQPALRKKGRSEGGTTRHPEIDPLTFQFSENVGTRFADSSRGLAGLKSGAGGARFAFGVILYSSHEALSKPGM